MQQKLVQLEIVATKMANKSWTVTLEEDSETGDLILPFPEDMLVEAGWKEGDVLEWLDNKDGTWSLVKQLDKTEK